MKKFLYGFVGFGLVTWYAIAMRAIDAQFSDDAILISMVIAASAGVLSAK